MFIAKALLVMMVVIGFIVAYVVRLIPKSKRADRKPMPGDLKRFLGLGLLAFSAFVLFFGYVVYTS